VNLREQVQEILQDENPDALFMDGFDEAIIGIARRTNLCVVAYDERICLNILMRQGMTYDEACDHFSFNVSGAWVGEHTPVIVGINE
jgi:hypothetical protein